MDCKLELALVPVSDVDRSRDYYTQAAGFTGGCFKKSGPDRTRTRESSDGTTR